MVSLRSFKSIKVVGGGQKLSLIKTSDNKTIWQSSGRLPSTYQEVEWIQSNNGAWTSINYSTLINSEFEVKISDIGYNAWIFSTEWTDEGIIGLHRQNVAFNNISLRSISTLTGGKYKLTKNGLYLEDTLINSITPEYSSQKQYLHLFKYYGDSTGRNSKMYYFKVYENNELVIDLVPCYHKTSGVIGLYDLINDAFYTNQGSGTFTKGADVN